MVTRSVRTDRRWLPIVLVAASILAQIIWILVPAGQRQLVTSAVVVLFTAASLSHAYQQFGAGWTVRFAGISVGFGLAIEVLGHTTDIPFGPYSYSDELQPQFLGVPVIVPLAWLMMAYPCLVLARWVSKRWAVLLGAVGLTTWDFFLDPQMVNEGYWIWERTQPALPGIPGIPVQNYLGWLVGTVILMWLLNHLPNPEVDLGVPLILYGWMWIGGVIANAVFLDRPGVAVVGGLGMAILGVPSALKWWRER